MSKQDTAQLIAGIAVATMTLVLAIVGRREYIAQKDLTYETADGTTRSVNRGDAIPRADSTGAWTRRRRGGCAARPWERSSPGPTTAPPRRRPSSTRGPSPSRSGCCRSWSRSGSVTIVHGTRQVARGLQEEYLLLLGGPFAAAVLAKYTASAQAATKTTAAPGDAAPSQLVTNDNGDTDLGDFQYVLFNAIGLTFFLGDFIGDLANGFPVLPPLLTGLLLTSTAGYGAKKLLPQVPPTLHLRRAGRGDARRHRPGLREQPHRRRTADVQVFVGERPATVAARELVLGNDRLRIVVPEDAPRGLGPRQRRARRRGAGAGRQRRDRARLRGARAPAAAGEAGLSRAGSGCRGRPRPTPPSPERDDQPALDGDLPGDADRLIADLRRKGHLEAAGLVERQAVAA